VQLRLESQYHIRLTEFQVSIERKIRNFLRSKPNLTKIIGKKGIIKSSDSKTMDMSVPPDISYH
jgi:hypothetical protein